MNQPNLKISFGKPFPLGASVHKEGVNFSIGSSTAETCTLVLFYKGEQLPFAEIALTEKHRFGGIFAVFVDQLDVGNIEYGYRFDKTTSDTEIEHRFDPSKVLLDPYARIISGRDHWRTTPDWSRLGMYRGLIENNHFDWGDTRPPRHPLEEIIIYELHVRGFTASPSSGVKHPGTFLGLIEKLPYLKDLGVTAIELLPIFEFDEHDGAQNDLVNYWGYNTVNFFSPKAGFAADKSHDGQINELKELVRQCHENNIEVFLDVVFNHTSEGDHRGNVFSFRGIDDRVYYLLGPEGYYHNYSGCGNTLNVNHPIVLSMIIDCLTYWVTHFRIDGFRFDLAAILTRDESGKPTDNPPLINALTHLPIFKDVKLIAEAWDAAGLYQVGHFPSYERFGEWNGKFRDCTRKFLKGDPGQIQELALRVAGSPDLYINSESHLGVNFITCHDGFTLHDMVSYNDKHNEANGHANTDGADDNFSWNHGIEGPTQDVSIKALRLRQMKNAFVLLLTSCGVPMISMGDEIARTQHGNNNVYCQDNPISWMDWTQQESNRELHRFVKMLIQVRKSKAAFGGESPLDFSRPVENNKAISFHGVKAWYPEYAAESHFLGVMFDENHFSSEALEIVYVGYNSFWEGLTVELPALSQGRKWAVSVNTGVPAPDDIFDPGQEPILSTQMSIFIGPRSSIVLVA